MISFFNDIHLCKICFTNFQKCQNAKVAASVTIPSTTTYTLTLVVYIDISRRRYFKKKVPSYLWVLKATNKLK